MSLLYFEDFMVGQVRELGGRSVSRQEIITFAETFDPQAMHVGAAAEKNAFVQELIASGWHTCSIQMRMLVDGFLDEVAAMGAPGITSLKWLKPLLPDDTLRTTCTILETRASVSKPDRGFVTLRLELRNQRDEIMLEQINPIMVLTRGSAEQNMPAKKFLYKRTEPWYGANGLTQQGFKIAATANDLGLDLFDDLKPGVTVPLGCYTFSAEDIVLFAQAFDPQPFHLDEEQGRQSHFGGLVASGWHVAACWMRLMIENRNQRAAQTRLAGNKPAQLGPSPGFKDMRWLKPTYAGDTLNYFSTLVDKRVSTSRPEWGIVQQRNFALNAKDELVFEFTGTVFWQRKPE